MDLTKIIAELRTELEAINQVLAVLDRLSRTREKRRGRPPLFLLEGLDVGAAPKRRPFSEETKKKMAAAQRKRWAAYRKAQKQAASSD